MDLNTSNVNLSRESIQNDIEDDEPDINRRDSVNPSLSGEGDGNTLWQFTSVDSIGGDFATDPSVEEYNQFVGLDQANLVQAVVFIEDAYKYRAINHRVDQSRLHIYRLYHSTAVSIFRWTVIFILHVLAFFEPPSSLTWTADLRSRGKRINSPCWLMQTIELMCLLLLFADNFIRGYLQGKYYFVRQKWDLCALILLLISVADWVVSAAFGCTEIIRIRRILRPFFILQNSSLMKKIVHCLRMTMPEVLSVLFMLLMHLYIFTLLGMLLFPTPQFRNRSPRNQSGHGEVHSNVTAVPIIAEDEGGQYFSSLLDSFMSLLILLTTANNPDVTMPAYSRNRLFAIFFMVFLIIGLYCFWNMLIAVIYNQFRGYFLNSMQGSLFRRRLGVRAAFEVLRRKKITYRPGTSVAVISDSVGSSVIKSVLEKTILPKPIKDSFMEKMTQNPERMYSSTDFQHLFKELDMEIKPPEEMAVRWSEHPVLHRLQRMILHKYFSYFGILVAFCNVIIITVELATEYEESFDNSTSDLRVANFVFAMYYALEQMLKVLANGPRRYIRKKANIFDALIIFALVVGELFSAVKFGVPFLYNRQNIVSITTLWNVLRIINILIMVRVLKIIPHIRSMQVITSVLLDLVSNMKAFAGVLFVVYYIFAIVGMELFHGVIKFNNVTDSNATYGCGTYQQLQYWANNFDDFAATIVVLWDIMVVNNWMVFLEAYRAATSVWSYLYFVAWWLISVVIILNLFTALIMENFILKWDHSQQMRQDPDKAFDHPINLSTVHDMFRKVLQEPDDSELLMQLCLHQYLCLDR